MINEYIAVGGKNIGSVNGSTQSTLAPVPLSLP
jgi:hypothetical protein